MLPLHQHRNLVWYFSPILKKSLIPFAFYVLINAPATLPFCRDNTLLAILHLVSSLTSFQFLIKCYLFRDASNICHSPLPLPPKKRVIPFPFSSSPFSVLEIICLGAIPSTKCSFLKTGVFFFSIQSPYPSTRHAAVT